MHESEHDREGSGSMHRRCVSNPHEQLPMIYDQRCIALRAVDDTHTH